MYIKETFTDELRSYHTFEIKGGPKKHGDILTHDLYLYYKENRRKKLSINESAINQIFFDFNREISKQIVYFGLVFRMPAGLGDISIEKRKRPEVSVSEQGKVKKRLIYAVNYNETKKLWDKDPLAKKSRKKIYIKYDGDYIYKWKWSKSGLSIRNKDIYRFTTTKNNRKMIKRALTNELYDVNYFN